MSDPKATIQSFSDRGVELLDIKPEQVTFDDVAHALAHKGRFTGQARSFYSVGQHCVLGAELLPPDLKLAFLLHELGEVYLPDIASPLKPYVQVNGMPWHELEEQHTEVILKALGLGRVWGQLSDTEIKSMDLAMCLAEAQQLLGPLIPHWSRITEAPANIAIFPWKPQLTEFRFREAFNRYQT